jgi:hypothetical protein
MKKKLLSLTLIASLWVPLTVSSSFAAPSIDDVFVFTDNRPPNDIFGNPGWNYSLQAIISIHWVFLEI